MFHVFCATLKAQQLLKSIAQWVSLLWHCVCSCSISKLFFLWNSTVNFASCPSVCVRPSLCLSRCEFFCVQSLITMSLVFLYFCKLRNHMVYFVCKTSLTVTSICFIISVLLWFSHTSTKSQVVENIIISVSFWPRYSIPREWKKLCYYTKKYKNQAGMNLTPPPPSQNSHAVGWHCTAESEWRVAEIKSWLLCCHPTDQQACDQVSKGRREAGIIIIVHFYVAFGCCLGDSSWGYLLIYQSGCLNLCWNNSFDESMSSFLTRGSRG